MGNPRTKQLLSTPASCYTPASCPLSAAPLPPDRYCARLAGLHPEDPLQAAKADQAVFQMADIMEVSGGAERLIMLGVTLAHLTLGTGRVVYAPGHGWNKKRYLL